MPKQRLLISLSIGLILAGIAISYLGLERNILLVVDGDPKTLRTRALTLRGVLSESGYLLTPRDRIVPSPGTLMIGRSAARLDRTQNVRLEQSPTGEVISLQSAERIPANLLAEAEIPLFPDDLVLQNGLVIDPYSPLPDGEGVITLEFRSALPITLQDHGTQQTIYSAAQTIGAALMEAGVFLSLADRVEPPAATALEAPLTVTIDRAQPVTIEIAGKTIQVRTTAETIEQLLVEAGIPLQGLDYSIPDESKPIPANRQVQVVRVREEMVLEQETIPFKSSYIQDSETELDTRRVITAGEYGIEVSRIRVRTENGVETERIEDAAWVAKEPQDQVIGYGIQPVVKTIDTPYGALEYWRAVNVFATSYSPCRLGIPNYCNTQTSSGAQLQQGIVAVTRAWYSWMRGQQVYIPGYGIATIADVGGGIPGRYWVDLGYTDADFKSWASNVTMYFLTPVPAAFPGILP